ncbi:MAG: hypothetical protein DRR16_02270 [Candidatus Parabeggiatoa sp. nov. 3]|nr:MAG: hypothetical protein DRR00_05400 [Gammaproteobacteria bacterium]RKZ65757.1 MAG: hypothetical protein DRQ99_11800 [Gammaproteobacteria bacterium]RKZ89570.1 MAG: hypothetical protein DRR16_02270 [Gammaproteobacteria bacterium]
MPSNFKFILLVFVPNLFCGFSLIFFCPVQSQKTQTRPYNRGTKKRLQNKFCTPKRLGNNRGTKKRPQNKFCTPKRLQNNRGTKKRLQNNRGTKKRLQNSFRATDVQGRF